jgi:hypothetical protein
LTETPRSAATPYNGAVERANGVLKTYTQQHAAAEAHPFRWTSDDVEAARQLANTMSRPWGYRGATPDEAWQARERLGDERRQAFRAAAQRERAIARKDLDLPPTGDLGREDQARLDRLALQRALCALDYLAMHRADRPKKAKRHSRAELAKHVAKASGEPPAVEAATDAAVGTPVEAAVENPQAADAPSNEASAADLATVDSPVDAPAAEAVAEPVERPRATAESNNALPHQAASGAVQENERLKLAPPMAADTMREVADGDVSVHSGAAPPAPAEVEPAKPPWPLRLIAPLFARPKTAMIT